MGKLVLPFPDFLQGCIEGKNAFIPLVTIQLQLLARSRATQRYTSRQDRKDVQLKVNAGESGEESGKGGHSRLTENHIQRPGTKN